MMLAALVKQINTEVGTYNPVINRQVFFAEASFHSLHQGYYMCIGRPRVY
jgi:hypothetical protein